MPDAPPATIDPATARTGVIEINVQSIRGLFNSMDPSPFREKDLDREAEEFIISWATELPHDVPIRLRIHFSEHDHAPGDSEAIVCAAIANYFAYRASMKRRELRQVLRQGRTVCSSGLRSSPPASSRAGCSARFRIRRGC